MKSLGQLPTAKEKHTRELSGLSTIDIWVHLVQIRSLSIHCEMFRFSLNSINSTLVVAKLHLVMGHFLCMRIRKLNLNHQIHPMTIHHPGLMEIRSILNRMMCSVILRKFKSLLHFAQ